METQEATTKKQAKTKSTPTATKSAKTPKIGKTKAAKKRCPRKQQERHRPGTSTSEGGCNPRGNRKSDRVAESQRPRLSQCPGRKEDGAESRIDEKRGGRAHVPGRFLVSTPWREKPLEIFRAAFLNCMHMLREIIFKE